jgi:hypothetical protein
LDQPASSDDRINESRGKSGKEKKYEFPGMQAVFYLTTEAQRTSAVVSTKYTEKSLFILTMESLCVQHKAYSLLSL